MVVFTADGHRWRRTDEIYEPVRIGAGLAETGKLGDDGIARGLATVEVFAHFCNASAITEIDAVATSAIRDAKNARDFIDKAALPVRVASTAEESRYGYLAAVNSTTLSDGAMLDLGGGSMQLVRVKSRHDSDYASWPLGAVRMTERFGLGTEEVASSKQLKKLREHVRKELEDAPWLERSGERIVGIGGTVRNLAVAVQRRAGLLDLGVQGYRIARADLDALVERLAAMTPTERMRVPGIKPARADLILAGAVTVQTVMDVGAFGELEVTEAGLREGVFFSHLLDLAAQYDVDEVHTAHVAHLALQLYDQLAEHDLHRGDPVERELLWSSCVLHDIGMAVDYDDHHKHGRYLVLHSGLPGFSQREVALIGQIVRYHRKGTPVLGDASSLARDGDEDLVRRCALMLRLAEGLERSRDQAVTNVTIKNGKKDHITLKLRTEDDAIAVARWAARREGPLFEQTFSRALRVS
jgi:exopolyphosphatase/guanosine-5'-triphosphate,3'-diphosphate pyrophosphatase